MKPPDDNDDDELAFLRAMHAMGAARQKTPARRTQADEDRLEITVDDMAAQEDELFDEYMQAVAEGRAPAPMREAEAPAEEVLPESAETADSGGSLHGAPRSLRRRLKKGEIAPTAQLDLHGQRRDQALNSLGSFLQRSRLAGHEIVLVITGRGLHSPELGVLREMVPLLLQRRWPEHVRQCLPAPPQLGGEGAFVVLLRR